jgi:hypothetical protein
MAKCSFEDDPKENYKSPYQELRAVRGDIGSKVGFDIQIKYDASLNSLHSVNPLTSALAGSVSEENPTGTEELQKKKTGS